MDLASEKKVKQELNQANGKLTGMLKIGTDAIKAEQKLVAKLEDELKHKAKVEEKKKNHFCLLRNHGDGVLFGDPPSFFPPLVAVLFYFFPCGIFFLSISVGFSYISKHTAVVSCIVLHQVTALSQLGGSCYVFSNFSSTNVLHLSSTRWQHCTISVNSDYTTVDI